MRLYRIGFHELLNCFITEICSWQFCSKKLQAGPSVTPFMKKKICGHSVAILVSEILDLVSPKDFGMTLYLILFSISLSI